MFLVCSGKSSDSRALKPTMSGPAKILSPDAQQRVLDHLAARRSATLARDHLLMLLSWRAGLRVCEMAGLEWRDVLDEMGNLASMLRVRRLTTKGRRLTRYIPLHPDLREMLVEWRSAAPSGTRQIVQ